MRITGLILFLLLQGLATASYADSGNTVEDAELHLDDLYLQLKESDVDGYNDIEDQIVDIWIHSGSPAMDLLLERGQSAMAVQDFPKAIEHFSKALDDPFYSSPSIALTNAGSCALGSGDMVEADEYLRRAIKIEPDFPDALLNMSRLNFEQEKYLTARAFMQRYEEVASHTPETLLLAYRVESTSGNRKAATTYKLMLESNFPESDQTAEVRRLSGR